MATFTIDSDNNIAVHAGSATNAENQQCFATEQELGNLAAEWPTSRLVEVWNSFAGVTPFDDLRPVKKFTSRKAAIARLWGAVQRRLGDGAEQARDVTPGRTRPKKSSPKASRRAPAQTGAKAAGTNKKAEVIAMIKRAKGATLAEIMKATGWQKHTVRGFMSILSNKGDQRVESSKNAGGERTYRIVK
jgi:hypothetical protein